MAGILRKFVTPLLVADERAHCRGDAARRLGSVVAFFDTDRGIAAAMGARSTPSALLVEPGGGKEEVLVRDVWYPYMAGHDGLVEGRLKGNMLGAFRPGEYLYLRALQADGGLAWSSPVFVEAEE